jgi:hypothetical protein
MVNAISFFVGAIAVSSGIKQYYYYGIWPRT